MTDKKNSKMREDFDKVQSYILALPDFSSEHPFIKAALDGLEQERKRQERDLKLRQKFSGQQQSSSSSSGAKNHHTSSSSSEVPVLVSSNPGGTNYGQEKESVANNSEDAATDDWQDLKASNSTDDVVNMETSGELVNGSDADDVVMMSGNAHDADKTHHRQNMNNRSSNNPNSSFLGERLAEQVIALIAQQHQATVKSPLSAVALALHAAMRSDTLGFACTGVPDGNGTKPAAANGGGFAAPVRELPSTQLLPLDWDKNGTTSGIALRYRKRGTGSVILQVIGKASADSSSSSSAPVANDTIVKVTLVPSAAPEPPSESLTFALSEHVNLDSFQRAAASSRSVAPALHYKALSSLLTKFCTTFDLGSVAGDDDIIGNNIKTESPYVDTSIQHRPSTLPPHSATANPAFPTKIDPAPPQFSSMVHCNHDPRSHVPTTIEAVFPGLRDPSRPGGVGRGGDFAMDKGLPGLPGGTLPGLPASGVGGGLLGDPSQSGNLMGPNHPMFHNGAHPGGMVPRYDPVFGPPGGPADLRHQDPSQMMRGDPQKKQRMNGNPNPDHLPPPGGFNMFL